MAKPARNSDPEAIQRSLRTFFVTTGTYRGEHLLKSERMALLLIDVLREYTSKQRIRVHEFVVMPDHLHALISFTPDKSIGSTVGDCKRFHARTNEILWQEGLFDDRLRNDERGEQLESKADYIRRNPVAAGLCKESADWPWVYPKSE